MRALRILAFTVLALCGFAANSLLCRAALGGGLADPATFTTLRLLSGALALGALHRLASRAPSRDAPRRSGGAAAAAALFVYAIAFSIAYRLVPAGVGALALFGAVQLTMIGFPILRGVFPSRREWLGLLLASGGLVGLVLPGSGAAVPEGVALMAAAGAAWGVYSLLGRSTTTPLAATAGNFARAVPLALGTSAIALLLGRLELTTSGALLAVTSGAIASGVCYAFWYAALPGLTAARAAIVQLCVPLLVALGGAWLLDEPPTLRLAAAGAAILGGIALAVLPKRPRG